MRIIFYYSNTHFPFAALAAAIHVECVPFIPEYSTSLARRFSLLSNLARKGSAVPAGSDYTGNKIYALWGAGKPQMAANIIFSFLKLYDISSEQVRFLPLDIKDDFTSRTVVSMANLTGAPVWDKISRGRILPRYWDRVTRTVHTSQSQNLTKTANYQIMLP